MKCFLIAFIQSQNNCSLLMQMETCYDLPHLTLLHKNLIPHQCLHTKCHLHNDRRHQRRDALRLRASVRYYFGKYNKMALSTVLGSPSLHCYPCYRKIDLSCFAVAVMRQFNIQCTGSARNTPVVCYRFLSNSLALKRRGIQYMYKISL